MVWTSWTKLPQHRQAQAKAALILPGRRSPSTASQVTSRNSAAALFVGCAPQPANAPALRVGEKIWQSGCCVSADEQARRHFAHPLHDAWQHIEQPRDIGIGRADASRQPQAAPCL